MIRRSIHQLFFDERGVARGIRPTIRVTFGHGIRPAIEATFGQWGDAEDRAVCEAARATLLEGEAR